MRRRILLAIFLLAGACAPAERPVAVGAMYPTGGGQGMGGADEFEGVRLAADLVNRKGGIGGRPAAAGARRFGRGGSGRVERLRRRGAAVILGSYGSTISLAAAAAATRREMVFWETGAVGQIDERVAAGERFFRFAPTGGSLGRSAVAFVRDRLLPLLLGPGARPRYSVAYVDDVYGRSVGLGAVGEIRASGLELAGEFPYPLAEAGYDELARRIGAAGTDVLVVAAYLEDGIALRQATISAQIPLVASIGTSSSYCMPEFGERLGADAVGLFASDKPDGDVLDPGRLSPAAGRTLRSAREEFRLRYGRPMGAAALSGFAGAWALFRHVLPRARSLDAAEIAAAARRVRLPEGGLPNGSGLELAPPGGPDAGANLRAVGVIWQWVRPGTREVVWPPAYATAPIVARPLS